MTWDRIQGSWKQVAGKAREQWGKLTDNDFGVIRVRRAAARVDTDGQAPREIIACVSVFADTEAGWRSP